MRRVERGFSLLELALVLVVIALLGAAGMGLSTGGGPSDTADRVLQQQLVQAAISFAQRNHRLPCPDTVGKGFENCSAGAFIGGVPFRTLEVNVGGEPGSAQAQSFIYGVYRQPSTTLEQDADLAVLQERTYNVVGELGYRARNDLVMALSNALKATPDAARLRVAGPGSDAKSSTCATPGTPVAFAIVYSGRHDADRATPLSDFDGAHRALSWPTGGVSCFENPALGRMEHYDDTVVAVSFTELLGYLVR